MAIKYQKASLLLSDSFLILCGFLTAIHGRGDMPTIAFVSPKGGAGKTTSAFLLSMAPAKLYDVTIIDADPNHPIQTWANGGNTPRRLTIMSYVDEDTIIGDPAPSTDQFILQRCSAERFR